MEPAGITAIVAGGLGAAGGMWKVVADSRRASEDAKRLAELVRLREENAAAERATLLAAVLDGKREIIHGDGNGALSIATVSAQVEDNRKAIEETQRVLREGDHPGAKPVIDHLEVINGRLGKGEAGIAEAKDAVLAVDRRTKDMFQHLSGQMEDLTEQQKRLPCRTGQVVCTHAPEHPDHGGDV